jgi:hypothetical protein
VVILLCGLENVIKSVDYQRRLVKRDQAKEPTFASVLAKGFSTTPCSVPSRLSNKCCI